MSTRQYPAKLLLFGEHILLLGARALATPVPAFSGQWAWPAPGAAPGQRRAALRAFAQSATLRQVPDLALERFQDDVEQGLVFDSNIPVGYGLGSSGALCAAVYDRYVAAKATDLSALKQLFAGMEGHFHGQSSGIDPLTSYLNRPLWIANRSEVSFFEPRPWSGGEPVIFLLDSKLPRQTKNLVEWFLDQSNRPAFSDRLKQDLLPAHDALLDAWQNGDSGGFWAAIRQVSAFQLNWMPPMIPPHLRQVWASCLQGHDIVLKICGAGGGGFMLGFAASKALVFQNLNEFAPVFPFDPDEMVEK